MRFWGKCWFIVAAVVLAAGLGLRDPWSPDEPRFAMVAVDMVETGEWLIPHTAGIPYPDKPPLFMWLIAALYSLTGSLRLSFLLPSFIAAMVSLFLVRDLARRLWNPRIALMAVLAQMTVLQFIIQAGSAQIDAVLCMWTTLGFYGICRHFLVGPAWGWYAIAGMSMGLGVITKGVGFLPLLALLPGLIMVARGWPRLNRLRVLDPRWLLAPAAMLAVVACWLVPMWYYVEASNDPAMTAYRDNILVKQTAKRYADSWHHHKHPFYFITEVIPSLWMPLAALLPWLIPAWWRRLRRGDARFALPLLWICLVLVFFSIPSGKRGVYILPAVPALALVTAPILAALARRPWVKWVALRVIETVLVLAVLVCIDSLTLGLVFGSIGPRLGFSSEQSGPIFVFGFIALGLAGVFSAWRLAARSMSPPLAFALCLWTIIALAGWVGKPLANPSISAKPFMTKVGQHIGPDAELGFLFWKEQFYLFRDREVTVFDHRPFSPEDRHAELVASMRWLLSDPDRWLMGPKEALTDSRNTLLLEGAGIEVGQRHRKTWVLMQRDDIAREKWRLFLGDEVP